MNSLANFNNAIGTVLHKAGEATKKQTPASNDDLLVKFLADYKSGEGVYSNASTLAEFLRARSKEPKPQEALFRVSSNEMEALERNLLTTRTFYRLKML